MKLKRGPIPLYYQIETALRKAIHNGEFEDGDPFPSEQQLCKKFGVSRLTVRQALTMLEDERLIKREQGRGTFVVKSSNSRTSFDVYGYVDDLLYVAENTQLKLTSKALVTVDAQLSRYIEMAEEEDVYLFQGFRHFIAEDYNAYFKAYVPKELGERISLGNKERSIFFTEIEEISMERVYRATQVTSASVADEYIASIMNVSVGHPLLVIKRIYYTKRDNILEVAVTYFPGDKQYFTIKLERVHNQTALLNE